MDARDATVFIAIVHLYNQIWFRFSTATVACQWIYSKRGQGNGGKNKKDRRVYLQTSKKIHNELKARQFSFLPILNSENNEVVIKLVFDIFLGDKGG